MHATRLRIHMYVCVRVHADISMCPHSGKGKQKWCGLRSLMAQGKKVVCVHIRLKVWSALVDGFEANKSSMCPHSAQGKKQGVVHTHRWVKAKQVWYVSTFGSKWCGSHSSTLSRQSSSGMCMVPRLAISSQ